MSEIIQKPVVFIIIKPEKGGKSTVKRMNRVHNGTSGRRAGECFAAVKAGAPALPGGQHATGTRQSGRFMFLEYREDFRFIRQTCTSGAFHAKGRWHRHIIPHHNVIGHHNVTKIPPSFPLNISTVICAFCMTLLRVYSTFVRQLSGYAFYEKTPEEPDLRHPFPGRLESSNKKIVRILGYGYILLRGNEKGGPALFSSSRPDRRPMVEVLDLDIDPPHLGDNRGDLDRLERAITGKGFAPLRVHLSQVEELVRRMRKNRFRVRIVLGYASRQWEIVDILPRFSWEPVLGFAVDLGTSTIVFCLVDLEKGEVIDRLSLPNPQLPYGEDILSRILYAGDANNRKTLQQLLLDTLNAGFGSMLARHGFSSGNARALVVAGNTAMSHFLLGLDPSNICREPYIPAANHFPGGHALDLRLDLHPRAVVYVFPNVGAYFGGDLIAGVLASGLHRSSEVQMLVDVGTNAEVILGNRDWLVACAGAAGPALEGGVVERGMMAAEGAIDRVRIDASTLEPSCHVLGDVKPSGICGSGLIDLVAEMFYAGILTVQGRINTALDSRRIMKQGGVPAYVLVFGSETADGADLLVSELDVGIFLKSKAAMYTILAVITRKVGIDFTGIRKFYIAGTFGNVIDPAMAIRIGMLPDLPVETYSGLGNASLKGAVSTLLDRSLLDDAEKVCNRIAYVELNVNMELMNEFRAALFLPHTDSRLFPSVRIPGKARI